jgi:Protein of unknown function (DUF992)
MKNFMKAMIVSATVALGAISTSGSASADSWVKLGTLTCHTKPGWGLVIGSSRSAKCIYSGINGKTVAYNARVTRIGLDVGYTANQTFVWAVLAPGNEDANSLKGTYVGATAEATVGIGVSANALVGGMEKSIALQPVSVGMQTGAGVVAAVSSLTLTGSK